MAIYDAEKRLRLRELGYDPDSIDEYNPNPPQPVAQQSPSTTVDQPNTS